jgi:hypothetical protein
MFVTQVCITIVLNSLSSSNLNLSDRNCHTELEFRLDSDNLDKTSTSEEIIRTATVLELPGATIKHTAHSKMHASHSKSDSKFNCKYKYRTQLKISIQKHPSNLFTPASE